VRAPQPKSGWQHFIPAIYNAETPLSQAASRVSDSNRSPITCIHLDILLPSSDHVPFPSLSLLGRFNRPVQNALEADPTSRGNPPRLELHNVRRWWRIWAAKQQHWRWSLRWRWWRIWAAKYEYRRQVRSMTPKRAYSRVRPDQQRVWTTGSATAAKPRRPFRRKHQHRQHWIRIWWKQCPTAK
jgi:hypothetical protein